MPICIHTGSGAPWMLPYFEHARNHTFAHGRALPIFAFRDLVANRIPEKFPGLRFGFIEASAGWAPFMIALLRRLFKDRPKYQNSVELFRDYNFSSPPKPTKIFPISPSASAKTTSSSAPTTATTIRRRKRNWSRACRNAEDIPRAVREKDSLRQSAPIVRLGCVKKGSSVRGDFRDSDITPAKTQGAK